MSLALATAQRPSPEASTVRAHQIPLTVNQRLRRAFAYAHSPEALRLVAATHRTKGRRRLYPVEAVLAAIVFHCLKAPDRLLFTDIAAELKILTKSQRLKLGFPINCAMKYARLYSGYRALLREIESGTCSVHNHELEADPRTGDLCPCPPTCHYIAANLDEFAGRMILTSIPATVPIPTTVAIDSTDFESHARPGHRSIDENGDTYWSADHDAAWGYRTSTDRRPTSRFHGYSTHAITGCPSVGGEPIPQLALGIAVRPGSRGSAPAALSLLDAFHATGHRADEVFLDRGYTTASAENLAHPLRDRSIRLVMDLHISQRGTRPGPRAGTIWQDGHLYSSALPQALRDLEPPKPTDTAAEKALIHEHFDARAPFRLVPHSRHDDTRGTQRLKGPALAGHVRCPNTPATMRLGPAVPTTNCTRGVPCGCGVTLTVPDTLRARDRQHLPWRSTTWALSFARRSLIEGLFGNIRYNTTSMNRGYLRVFGHTATTFMLTLAFAGYNMRHLHHWYIERGLPDPWQIELDEKPHRHEPDWIYRTRGP